VIFQRIVKDLASKFRNFATLGYTYAMGVDLGK
jgi:hypothetical protein